MKTVVCKQLDLPEIPSELLDWRDVPSEFFSVVPSASTFNRLLTQEHYHQGQKIRPVRCTYTNVFWPAIQEWWSQMLYGIKQRLSIWYTTIPNHYIDTTGRMFMHIDYRRSATLQYIIDTGGDNVRTNFYQERGGPLFQDTAPNLEYDDVDLIDSVHMKKNCWYLFRSDVLHDVTGIENTRRHISVNFLDLDYWEKQTS